MSHESFDRTAPAHASSNRAFGFVFTAFFAIVAAFPLIRGRPFRMWGLVASVVFLGLTLVAPNTLTPLNQLWTKFGAILNRITNPIILGLMFYLIITPVGLIMRAFGRDPLRMRLDRDARSYWIDRTPPGPTPDSLKHQF